MKFEYIENHRNVSEEQMIEDLQLAATKSDHVPLRKADYLSLGKYNPDTVRKRFGSWNLALQAAGLPLSKVQKKPRYKNATREELIVDLRQVACSLGQKTLTSTDYNKNGHFHSESLRREFGSWEKALEAANLLPTGFHRNITKAELYTNIEYLWIAKGKQPTVSDLQSELSQYGLKAYYRVFGSWTNALRSFVEYMNDSESIEEATSCSETEGTFVKSNNPSASVAPFSQSNYTDAHQTTRTVGDKLRFKVFQRDNFKCCVCGASPATDSSVILHVDHIFPWSKGGETTIDNLQTLCSKCNFGKGNLIV